MGDNEYGGGEDQEHQEQHEQGEQWREDADHDDAGVGEGEDDWGDDGGWGEDGPGGGFRGRGGWRGPRGRGMRGFGRGGFGRGFGRGFGPPGMSIKYRKLVKFLILKALFQEVEGLVREVPLLVGGTQVGDLQCLLRE